MLNQGPPSSGLQSRQPLSQVVCPLSPKPHTGVWRARPGRHIPVALATQGGGRTAWGRGSNSTYQAPGWPGAGLLAVPASWKPWSCNRRSLGRGQRPPTVQGGGRPPNPHHAGLLKDDSRAGGGETWSPGWKRGRAFTQGACWIREAGPSSEVSFPCKSLGFGACRPGLKSSTTTQVRPGPRCLH